MAFPDLVPPVLHPVVVHFPIALLLVAALVAVLRDRVHWAGAVLPWLLVLAAVSSVVAVVTGLVQRPDAMEAWADTAKEDWITTHMVLGILVALASTALAVVAVLKRADWGARVPLPAVVAVCTVGLLVGVTGWYGGAIVWDALPDEGGGLQSADGSNPFQVSEPADGSTEPSDPGSGGGTGGSDPGSEPGGTDPPASSSGCPTYAPGTSTPHGGGYDGFYGEDTGTAGDSGLPVWELTVVSGTTAGQHYYHTVDGQRLDPLKVPSCREVHVTHHNEGGANHDFDVGDWRSKDAFVLDTPDLKGGQTATGVFVVEVEGQVSFFCSVGKHASQGQRGTFTVAAAS